MDRLLGGQHGDPAGVATAALALGLDHCFGPVTLHRVEATVRPENGASRAVLSKVGFREEGLLKRYLDVDGAWRDHLLVAMTVEEVRGLSPRRWYVPATPAGSDPFPCASRGFAQAFPGLSGRRASVRREIAETDVTIGACDACPCRITGV